MTTFEQIGTMGKIKHSHLLVTASALAISAICLPAVAQRIVANGTTVGVPADTVIVTEAASNPAGSALVAVNDGVIETLGQVTLTTGGAEAHAALSRDGTINLNGGAVTTAGDRAAGLVAAEGVLTSNGNLIIRTTGNDRAHGINAQAASTVTLGGTVDVATDGAGSVGLFSDATSTITSDGRLTIKTTGNDRAHGIHAQASGTVTLDGAVDIETTGDGSRGLFSDASTITSNGRLTIKTTGNDRANGIHAQASGTVILGGTVDVATDGAGSVGLFSNASTITSNGPLTIRTSGNDRANGIHAQASGTVTLDGAVDIETTGDGSRGLFSDASTITSNGPLTVRTSGNGRANGITGQTASSIILGSAVDVATIGDGSVGLYLDTSTITSNGPITIRTSGNESAHGITAQVASTVTLGGTVDVVTVGDGSAGLVSSASTVISNGSLTIKTSGNDYAQGVHAQASSSLVLNGAVDVVTVGDGSAGLVSSASTVISNDKLAIRTSGMESHGIFVRDGSTVKVSKGDIVTQGAAAAGIYTDFIRTNRVSTVLVANGTVGSEQGDLVRSEGGALDVTLDAVTTHNGRGAIAVVDDAAGNHGAIHFNAINTNLMGDIFAATGNIADVSFTGSRLTGAAYNATNISLDAGSVWNVTHSSMVSGTVSNAGMVAFVAPDAGVFKALMTTDYIGNNGTVVLNTMLGADGSPSDQIVISGGAAAGRTGLFIHNVAGTGAPTTDGIKVVNAINGGATNVDAFFLSNGNYVTEGGQNAKIAGAYAYTLNRGAVSHGLDVYGDSYAANDWYLRSILTDRVDPADPITEPALPRYHPGVPIYETYPATLQILNRLPTLTQRTGDRYWHDQAPAQNTHYQDGAAMNAGGNNAWGRIERLHGYQQPGNTTSRSDYDYNLWKLQAGIDGQLYESGAGRLIGGVTVHYGQVKTDVSSIFGTGSIDTSGYGFGGTLTWYGYDCFYLDAQGQVSWYDSDLYSDTLHHGLANGNDGFGYGFSVEAGKRTSLNENWTLTPQAQLTWSSVDFDSFTDTYGAHVSLGKGDSLKGRLGLSLEHKHTWKDTAGQASSAQVYGIVNLTSEFLDGTRVNVSGAVFESRAERLAGGIGLGGTYKWANDKYAVYGEVSANTSLKSFADNYEVGGKLGLRVKF
ncbi:autotransporter outer membrane beta-barrel domain-containing protein [Rhizobium sp. NPDC090279]|uniref:autotransporter outer membrane beta-barrel domain-containing protein n=1 Tax=Rhizobium sp. NPDC090279 TaxID=3364499 RepID=UPI00383AF667